MRNRRCCRITACSSAWATTNTGAKPRATRSKTSSPAAATWPCSAPTCAGGASTWWTRARSWCATRAASTAPRTTGGPPPAPGARKTRRAAQATAMAAAGGTARATRPASWSSSPATGYSRAPACRMANRSAAIPGRRCRDTSATACRSTTSGRAARPSCRPGATRRERRTATSCSLPARPALAGTAAARAPWRRRRHPRRGDGHVPARRHRVFRGDDRLGAGVGRGA